MKFETAEEAKKWLRGLPLLKKELQMKTTFYQELMKDSKKLGTPNEKYIGYYQAQMDRMQKEMQELTEKMEGILSKLEPDERVVLTARYIKGVLWDAMEFYTHYSRRQAIRIHNQAIERLVGQEIEAVAA